MATLYQSPGVYMEEVDRGAKPIEGVGTAVAAFIGFTERAEAAALNKPVLVTNWQQYTQKFGGFVENAYLPYAVYGYFANGGGRCYIISLAALGATDDPRARPAQVALPSAGDSKSETLTVRARQGGTTGNDLSVAIQHEISPTASDGGGETFELMVQREGVEVERFPGLTVGAGDSNAETVVNALSRVILVEITGRKTGKLSERRPAEGLYRLSGGEVTAVAVAAPQFLGNAAKREGLGALEALEEVTMVCVPDLMTVYKQKKMEQGKTALDGVKTVQQAMLDHCRDLKYRFAILDAPPEMDVQQMKEWRKSHGAYDAKHGALYYPWISVADPLSKNGQPKFIPPCGHIAGLYARSDSERGVHKAPANEVVAGTIGLELNVTKAEQEELNPAGVNCIRFFPGRGIRVWGARTLSSDSSWRYINVRRLFNYVEASIERGTQWVVFEPNDADLWARVRRDVTAFLRTIWRSGALFGATPEEAFYVKCDEEINPPEVRDLGQLIIEVGLAPTKPAEFVIFRISQWAGPNAQS